MIRRAFTMRLKPDSLAEYKRHHDHIWPELVEEIDKSGIASITTYQRGLDLFLVSEISDLAAWDRLWNSEIHRRWAEVMRPLMHLRDDGIVDSEILTEVFHFSGSQPARPHAAPSISEESRGEATAEDAEPLGAEQHAETRVAGHRVAGHNGSAQPIEQSESAAAMAASPRGRGKKSSAKRSAKKAAVSAKAASRNGKSATAKAKKKTKKGVKKPGKKATKKAAPKKAAKKAKRPMKKKASRR